MTVLTQYGAVVSQRLNPAWLSWLELGLRSAVAPATTVIPDRHLIKPVRRAIIRDSDAICGLEIACLS